MTPWELFLAGTIDAESATDSRMNIATRSRRIIPARLVRASSVAIERPLWVWDLRIPVAGVTLVAGREGMGKTAITGHVAAPSPAVEFPGDFYGRPADVVYVGDEDDRASVLVPRLLAAGADLYRVHFMDLPGCAVLHR